MSIYVNYFRCRLVVRIRPIKRPRDARPVFAPAAVTAGVGAAAGPDGAGAEGAAGDGVGPSREMPKRPEII